MQIAPEALQAPIPGMSLTQPPREATWENPPELNELSEVAKHYTTKLLEPNVVPKPTLIFLDFKLIESGINVGT